MKNVSQNFSAIELVAEKYLGLGGKRQQELEELQKYSLYARATQLSVAGSEDADSLYLKSLRDFVKSSSIKALHVSLGFCFHKGVYLGRMFPAAHSPQIKKLVVERLLRLKHFFECPIRIENISHANLGLSQYMDSLRFLKEISEESALPLVLNYENLKQTYQEYGRELSRDLNILKTLPLAYVVIEDSEQVAEVDAWGAERPLLLRKGHVSQKGRVHAISEQIYWGHP
ncbi:MAG: DUF692 family multinuclear iron-containing protein [Bdellovibrionales bacterium]